jgi:hypothetical protein
MEMEELEQIMGALFEGIPVTPAKIHREQQVVQHSSPI